MGRGGGGRGGGGGGGGKGKPRFRFLRGFYGPSPTTQTILRRVAIEKGLRDVDQLLASLGKEAYEISTVEAFDLMEKECSNEVFSDVCSSLYYHPGKGYGPCNQLLGKYIQVVKESNDPVITRLLLSKLTKYCGYTKNELNDLIK